MSADKLDPSKAQQSQALNGQALNGPQCKPAPYRPYLDGEVVDSFSGIEPILAVPREQSNQNWSRGKVIGKSSVDLMVLCSSPPGILVYSSLAALPGRQKDKNTMVNRTFVPLANVKNILFATGTDLPTISPGMFEPPS